MQAALPKQDRIVDAVEHVRDQHHDKHELEQLEQLLQHHHVKPMLLVVDVDAGEKRIQILYMVPSC